MQQVNLYTDDFRPKKIVLPLAHIVLIPIGVIVILAALSYWLNIDLAEGEAKVANKTAQADEMKQRLVLLEEKVKRLKRDDSLVSANKRLQAKLDARQQMIEILDSVVVKDNDGFSNLLTSLARQKADGLWLKHINIGASGHSMTLEGRTLNADSVPGYLQNLRREPGFIGRSFTLFSLQHDPENSKGLDFSLRSETTGQNEAIVVSLERPAVSGDLDDPIDSNEAQP